MGFFFFFLGRQVAPPGAAVEEEEMPVCLPLSRLTARQGDVAQVEDRKWVSLRVEDPTLQRHQVVAGEQQVQIPEGGVGGGRDVWGGGGEGEIHRGRKRE